MTTNSRSNKLARHFLDANEIFDSTAKKHGLEEYVDAGMRRRFSKLIESFNDNGSIAGWAMPEAVAQLSRLVHRRLELARDWALHPEIGDEHIGDPFLVISSGRTGSTAMQSLLALGDGCRSPRYWEIWQPSPPPGYDPESEPARIAAEHEHSMRDIINVAPGLLLSHPYFDAGAFSELEDEELFTVDFHTTCPTHFMRVPNLPFGHAKGETALIDALRFHKKMLQHWQWKTPTKHWVCKTTQHFFELPTTWEIYPNAMIVFMHRDPVIFLAALLGVLEHIYTPINGKYFRGELANGLVDSFQTAFDAISEASWPDDKRVVHVRFDDFVRDQAGTVRRIYEHNGLSFSAAAEDRIRRWVADPANKSDRHGKFIYSLEQFGLDPADIRKKFAKYCDRFLN